MSAAVRAREPRVLRRRWQELCDGWDEESERPGAVQPSWAALRYLFFGPRRKP